VQKNLKPPFFLTVTVSPARGWVNRGHTQMQENTHDHGQIFDGSDDVQLAAK